MAMAKTYFDVQVTAADLNELYDVKPAELQRMLRRHGSSMKQFAEHYGISRSQFSRIVSNSSALTRKMQESAADFFGGIPQFIALKTLVRGELRPEAVPESNVKRRRRK